MTPDGGACNNGILTNHNNSRLFVHHANCLILSTCVIWKCEVMHQFANDYSVFLLFLLLCVLFLTKYNIFT